MKTNSTYLFYDFETTGVNKVFDQVLTFAGIRTTLDFEEIERFESSIRLRPDVIPHIKALLTNRLSMNEIKNGETEYEVFRKIHGIMNQTGTISVGYNSNSFDNEFLRYGFYRNLLMPYLHEWADGCRKMDIMPIVEYCFVKEPEALIWPDNSVEGRLRLENLNAVNNLSQGMDHTAITDVLSTIELTKRIKNYNNDLWIELSQCFQKDYDRSYLLQVPVYQVSANEKCQVGALIRAQEGYKDNCIAQVLKLGEGKYNESYWLRLDRKDFTEINKFEDKGKLYRELRKRKLGIPNFIVPIDDSIKEIIGNDRVQRANDNLKWINQNFNLFSEIREDMLTPEYPEKTNIDIDASLYPMGFFTTDEESLMQKFHDLDLDQRASFLMSIEEGRIKELGVRILGRNFPEQLDEPLTDIYQNSIGDNSSIDISRNRRHSLGQLLTEIKKEKESSILDEQQRQIIESVEKYYKPDFHSH